MLGKNEDSLRKEEYNRIWMLLEMFMESTAPLSMFVIASGKAGTGKTTLAKRIILDATSSWKELKAIYLDPFDNPYGFSVSLQKILNLSGYSTLEILRTMEENNCKFLIVIDNAETIIYEKSIRDILKIGEGFPYGRFFIMLFFSLANIPVTNLSFSTPIYFMRLNSYSLDEIRMILSTYLNKFGNPFVSENALNAISRASGGNASLALEMLRLAIRFSMGRPVDEKLILEVLKIIDRYPFLCESTKINDPHMKSILKVVSQYPQGICLKRLFEEYRIFCKDNGMKPLGYTQLWKKIRILEKKMLLDFKVVNLRKGRSSIVKIKCMSGKTSL
ncbi:MAG: hypothetical protein RMI79_01010 [Nitrososphaerota archaeon]|nr:hypothetical protein [Nitrososphaerota archaeon]